MGILIRCGSGRGGRPTSSIDDITAAPPLEGDQTRDAQCAFLDVLHRRRIELEREPVQHPSAHSSGVDTPRQSKELSRATDSSRSALLERACPGFGAQLLEETGEALGAQRTTITGWSRHPDYFGRHGFYR